MNCLIKKIERSFKKEFDKLTFSYRQSKDFSKDYPELFPLALSDKEVKFILDNCSGIKTYLEFGAGGSTFLSLLNFKNISKIVSVESDPNWIAFLMKWNVIRKACEDDKLSFESVDIGKVGAWGVPVEVDAAHKYPDYSSNVFKHEYVKNNSYDLVFIDGRFRVACLLQTILNVPCTTKIMIHDFCDRPEYHVVLKYIDVIEPIDTLCLFKIKENFSRDEVVSDYQKFKLIYD